MNETLQNVVQPGHGHDIVPMDLLNRAVASGVSPEVWEKLMGLHERWEANQARKAFDHALAAAKGEFGEIKKSKLVDYTTKFGRTRYVHEDLKDIERAVSPALSKHGLYYRWNTAVTGEQNEQIIVTCVVCHRDGHAIENSLPGAPDNSAGKNAAQSMGSVVTYLCRYTLKAALGLAADEDDDGQAAGKHDDRREETSSGATYVERWQMILANATSRDDLTAQWNAEIPLRKNIEWRGAQYANLKDAVTRRREELTPKTAPPKDEQDDLTTQRLKAEET